MKKNEITVGSHYVAKVSNRLVTVRVDAIREVLGYVTGASYWTKRTPDKTVYDVTNLATGRKTTFRSAAKFRSVATKNQAARIVETDPRTGLTPQLAGPQDQREEPTAEDYNYYYDKASK